WAAWVKRLGHDYRVVTLDLPGFGLTRTPEGKIYSYQETAEVVEAFAKAKQLDRFTVGGSSMGGGVAWRFALAHPGRVRGLILVDATGWPEPPTPAENSPLVKASQAPGIGPAVVKLDNSSTLRGAFRTA